MLIIKKSKANFLEILIKIMTLVAVVPVLLLEGMKVIHVVIGSCSISCFADMLKAA